MNDIDEFLSNPEFNIGTQSVQTPPTPTALRNTVDDSQQATNQAQPQQEALPEIPEDVANIMSEMVSGFSLEVPVSQVTGDASVTYTYTGDSSSDEDDDSYDEEAENEDSDDEEYVNDEHSDPEVQETPQQPEQLQSTSNSSLVYDTISDTTARFRGASWFEIIQQQEFSVIGVGGIGSYVGFLLSRLHPAAVAITDDDRVEEANLSGQMYRNTDIGRMKTDALASIIHRFSSYTSLFCNSTRVTPDRNDRWAIKKVTLCGLDNMEARKICYTKWLNFVTGLSEEERQTCLFIDGRLAMEEYQVYCIPGNNTVKQQKYLNEALFSGEEAEETVCSLKQTSFMACGIASMMVNLLVNFFCNIAIGAEIRDVPFFTSYSGPCVFLTTE